MCIFKFKLLISILQENTYKNNNYHKFSRWQPLGMEAASRASELSRGPRQGWHVKGAGVSLS